MRIPTTRILRRAASGAAVLAALAFCAAPFSARAALKYQPDDYVQEGLVVHLDGIANAGIGKPHDPGETQWANLANPTNPAAIKANASSGWRKDGYYFCWADNSSSYAQLVSATPAMTQATFEFAVDAKPGDQGKLSWGCTFISANYQNDDQRICTTAEKEILFKGDKWTGNNTRPIISSWSWKQASFTLAESGSDNFKAYDQGAAKTSGSSATSGTTSIPETKWMFGSRLNQSDVNMQLTGTMRSVRIYNRALSAGEVEQNAAADAARFEGVMPVTNAVVATSQTGAEGYEATGVYAVDGSHVFTAPAVRTVSGETYALAGCTVEKWEGGAWGAPETRTGVFAVEVAESEKVRITWDWTKASGTPGGYVTDGLVVWLDGIANAGAGKPHDPSATQWANLADASNPAAITANASSKWMDDGYYFCWASSKPSYAQLVSAAAPMTKATFEFAVDAKAGDQSSVSWGTAFFSSTNHMRVCAFNGGLIFNALEWTGGSDNNARSQFTSWGWKQASFTHGAAGADGQKAYENGVQKDSRSRTSAADGSIPSVRWTVGTSMSNITQGQQFNGTMRSFRIYNRALSAGEVAQNAAADAARFDTKQGGVEIAPDPRGFAGREAAGFYVPDCWTFSAGATTYTLGGVEYAPAGYIEEEWDDSVSAYVFEKRVMAGVGNAVEYAPPAAPFANRRITWLWEPVSGIRRASDYSIHDYAPVGMVVWYDGICNDGIGAPHQDAADFKWRELVTGEQANMAVNSNSGWESDGYHLALGPGNEKSYFYLNTPNNKLKSLGTVGTMEIACDVKGSEQVGEWPCLLSFGHTNTAWTAHDNDMSIHTYGKDGSCRWKTDTWSGGDTRANITQPWDGRHAAFVMDTARFRSYKAGVVDQTQTRPAVKEMPAAFFFVGNKFYQNGKANNNSYSQLTGTMKAVRAYSRVLSDAEIAQNYKVDVARFDGALVTTNVVVAASDYNGSLAADAYEVFGTHVFTASASAADGSAANCVKVWTFRDGEWVRDANVDAPSYTYVAGTSPATVKIEFGRTSALVLVVR